MPAIQHKHLESVIANQVNLTTEQILQLDQLFAADQIQGERYPDAGWTGIETA